MGRPSIFSREYERKMKRRKRNFMFFSLIIIVLACAAALKFVYNPVNFGNIKANIQAWIDSDTTSKYETVVENEENPASEENAEVVEEEIAPVEEYLDIPQSSGNTAQAVYIEENGEKVFTEVRNLDNGVTFDISPLKKQVIIYDVNSNITLYNIDGTNKVVSKDQYISTSGTVFTKDSTLQSKPDYLWNSNPKFVNEQNIIFVTNRPYFGTAAVKQYLWMTDLQSGTDKIYWDLAAASITIGSREEKGLKVTVDGRDYYIAEDGSYIQ
ncbi:hypothetical protein [uncultured Clostridium sp.]|uniref:hypothetical protein n=1 Tax=uncultured Clostridium sp. TaxID=59620 RepID=UPI0025DA079B|nr:hypothetical protein [uncultured Clostridium sp.]